MPRPELGPIAAGDPVVITDPDRRDAEQSGFVVKVARVWITVGLGSPDDGHSSRMTYRMRRDSQSQATGFGHGGHRFATPEQHAWDQRLKAANRYLREQGVDLRSDSPWRSDERRLILANLLRAEAGLDPL